jgi:hypothetical protein
LDAGGLEEDDGNDALFIKLLLLIGSEKLTFRSMEN